MTDSGRLGRYRHYRGTVKVGGGNQPGRPDQCYHIRKLARGGDDQLQWPLQLSPPPINQNGQVNIITNLESGEKE